MLAMLSLISEVNQKDGIAEHLLPEQSEMV